VPWRIAFEDRVVQFSQNVIEAVTTTLTLPETASAFSNCRRFANESRNEEPRECCGAVRKTNSYRIDYAHVLGA